MLGSEQKRLRIHAAQRSTGQGFCHTTERQHLRIDHNTPIPAIASTILPSSLTPLQQIQRT
jgi:hypothetical protein